ITDVNETPVGAISDTDNGADTVAENAAIGAVVGVTAQASDPDGTDAVTYSLSDDAGGLFGIDSHTGVVTVAGALDAETAISHSITVTATSSDGSTSRHRYTITVTDVDEFDVGPITDADASESTVAENAAVGSTVGITASASDADVTDGVTYSLSDDAGGLFAIDANTGVVTIASSLDYEAAASHAITVRATSDDGSANSAIFTITVSDVNDNAPVVTPGQILSVDENSASSTVVGTVAATDSDSAATLQGWQISGGSGQGAFAIDPDTGAITVADPNALNHETNPSFTLQVSVSDGTWRSATETVTVQLNDLNELPSAVDNSISTTEDTPVVIENVMANDGVADGANRIATFQDVSDQGGQVTDLGNGAFRYQPPKDFNGVDAFTYTIADANGDLSQATVTLLITAENDAPVAEADEFLVEEDQTLFIAVADLLANDSDVDGDTLTVQIENGPAHGLLNTQPDGSFAYTPDADFTGVDHLRYSVSDGDAISQSVDVVIRVAPVNDAPVAQDGEIRFDEDSRYALQVSDFQFSDTDGDALAGVEIETPPGAGELRLDGKAVSDKTFVSTEDLAAGKLTYQPEENAWGDDYAELSFRVFDGQEMSIAEARLTINVNPVNDAPILSVIDSMDIQNTGQAAPLSKFADHIASISSADSEQEIQIIEISVQGGALSVPENPDVEITGNNTSTITLVGDIRRLNGVLSELIFRPEAGFHGETTLTIRAGDYQPGATEFSETASIALKVEQAAGRRDAILPPDDHAETARESLPAAPALAVSVSREAPGRLTLPPEIGPVNKVDAPHQDEHAVLHTEVRRLTPRYLEQPATEPEQISTVDFGLLKKLLVRAQRQMFDMASENPEETRDIRILPLSLDANGAGLLNDADQTTRITIDALEFGTIGLTIGTILWLLRSGGLLSSLLLTYPVWRNIDPLPVFSRGEQKD
ncbi:MAG TPA: tandem-95 repeat protein, partial [Gammaproteobacteria bacterium]|nr:tandem-95 repeat protein [Gammaproteobacteria bacterium]